MSGDGSATTDVARSTADLTPDWITAVLRESNAIATDSAVTAVATEIIGAGQLAHVVRADLEYAGEAAPDAPGSVVVKLASESDVSRHTGMALGAYEGEVRFFERLAPTLGVSVPRCHLAALDPEEGWFTLVFEDLTATTEVGDMREGGTVEQASVALLELAKLQVPHWNDPALREMGWLADPTATQTLFTGFSGAGAAFLEDFEDALEPEQLAVIERVAPKAREWLDGWAGPEVVQHGDYRLDNMMFGSAPGTAPVTLLDWQWVRLGPPAVDAAFYLGGCLPREVRREVERDLLRDYHAALLAGGVEGYDFDQLWEDYRRYSLYGLYIAVGAYQNVRRNDVSRALFELIAAQYADLAIDLAATELLGK